MIYINDFGGICSAGKTPKSILKNLAKNKPYVESVKCLNKDFVLGRIKESLPQILELPKHLQTRTNLILYEALLQIKDSINEAINKYGSNRVGVVIGTTTAGVEENFLELEDLDFEMFKKRNSLSNPSEFVAHIFNLHSLRFGVSSACTSGAKALVCAKRLLDSNLCDAVICGGVDSLNTLTIFGFESLDILSNQPSLPFSKNRSGVNLGEGAAVFLLSKFLLSKLESKIVFKGYGSNNDAFHITKPSDSCVAQKNMLQQALKMAKIKPSALDYINLHGTGTLANDSMESKLVSSVFSGVPCSSTKSVMGHTLGAAGALEAMVCVELLRQSEKDKVELPLHCFDGEWDTSLEAINLVKTPQSAWVKNVASLSFAFGGDNCVLIFGVDK